MQQQLSKLREPTAVALLVVLALRLVLGLVSSALAVRSQGGLDAPSLAAWSLGYTVTDALTVVLLVVLVGSCLVWEQTPHARSLGLATLVLAGVGVLLATATAVAWTVMLGADGIPLADTARLLLDLAVPVVALVVLARLRSTTASLDRRTAIAPPAAAALPAPAELEGGAVRDAERDPENEPVWEPDQASGAAWLTAGDAATGAAASGWGTPGEAGGWRPASGPQPDSREQPAERQSRAPELP